MADMIDSGAVATVAAATGVLATIAGAVVFPIRWVQGAIKTERDERIKADDALRADIQRHRDEEVTYQQRTSDRLAEVATKADLHKQTDLLLRALELRATRVAE